MGDRRQGIEARESVQHFTTSARTSELTNLRLTFRSIPRRLSKIFNSNAIAVGSPGFGRLRSAPIIRFGHLYRARFAKVYKDSSCADGAACPSRTGRLT